MTKWPTRLPAVDVEFPFTGEAAREDEGAQDWELLGGMEFHVRKLHLFEAVCCLGSLVTDVSSDTPWARSCWGRIALSVALTLLPMAPCNRTRMGLDLAA